MPDVTANLSNDDIATLTEIAQNEAAPSAPAKAYRPASIAELLAAGFIESSGGAGRYKTTRQGQDFMSSRGASLNEA
jgi:hypothetical protein